MPPTTRRPPDTIGALVDVLRAGDASRPVVTWLDAGTGARVELSVATLANWVAKTGGFLQDGLDVAAGDRVRLSLPVHWLAITWALGCWVVGAVIEPDDVEDDGSAVAGGHVAIEVFGEDRSPRTSARGVVVGLAPFGGPARARVDAPAGSSGRQVVDAGSEVLGHPDELFVLEAPAPSSPALVGAHGQLADHATVLASAREAAAELGLRPGARLLAAAPPGSGEGLVSSVLAPLVAGGSVLLVRGRRDLEDAGALAALVEREEVDVVAPLGSHP